jgi:protein SCO1
MIQTHSKGFAGLQWVVLIAVATLALTACQPALKQPAAIQFNSVDITGVNYAQTLNLPDISNRPRTLLDFKGKVTFVFFGFTQCPDVCPTTMSDLAEVKKLLGKDGERLQGVFVSVDPERDTPAILKEYLGSFDASFVGLRGSLEQTQAAAREFKIFYAKVPGKTEGSYTVDHSTGSYVLDTQGRPRLFVRRDVGVKALAADLKALLG